MAKIARLVADPHADKDAEIYDAEHVAAIAEFNEKAALARVAKLEAALTKIRDNDPDGWEAAIARTALQ